MAIGQVAFVFVSRNYKLTGGDDGLVGIVMPEWLDNNIAQHYLAVLALFITGIFLLRLLASPLGATFSAVRDNPDRVASLGGNPKLFEITAMMIGGVLAAMFGTILAATEGSVEPNLFSWVTSTMFLMMVALGGRSIFLGPLIGAVILEITRAYIQSKSANADLVVGLVVIACAVLFPEGLGPQFKKLMSRIKNFDLAKTKGGDSV
jgi:branched-chain amino acid transport system permease protein